MIPVDFPGCNKVFTRPANMTDEQCGSLYCMVAVTEDGIPLTRQAWQPNKEDIEAINAGRPIFIDLLTHHIPPVAVFTFDDKGEIN